jgi:hypothetical protein
MPSDGKPRARAGRPLTATSEKLAGFRTLPAEGYKGRIPKWPLDDCTEREAARWKQVWRTPQAAAWATQEERWRVHTVAMFVRWSVRSEDLECPPGVATTARQLMDEVGLSTAGMRANGWRVAADELASRKAAEPAVPTVRPRRMRAAGGG